MTVAIDHDALTAARRAAPTPAVIQLLAETFRILADPTRLRLLHGLSTGALSVRDLALLAEVSESAISHQLRVLRERGLVSRRRAGTVIYYSLTDHHLPSLLREAAYHVDHARRGRPDHPYPEVTRHSPGRVGERSDADR